jgi:hypothetical protein
MSSESSPSQVIVTAILASQLMSVPFTCSLTLLVSILAWRYISKTTAQSLPKLGYFEYPCATRRAAGAEMVRIGAGLVASICIVLTILELVVSSFHDQSKECETYSSFFFTILQHVYQAAVVHPRDLTYFQKTPWTFALIPLLTAFVPFVRLLTDGRLNDDTHIHEPIDQYRQRYEPGIFL